MMRQRKKPRLMYPEQMEHFNNSAILVKAHDVTTKLPNMASVKSVGTTCAIHQLLKQMEMEGDPFGHNSSQYRIVEEITRILQNTNQPIGHRRPLVVVSQSSMIRLHGMLLLRLGFLMSTYPSLTGCSPSVYNSSCKDETAVKFVTILLQCLQALYFQSTNELEKFEKDDLHESFSLVLQLVFCEQSGRNHYVDMNSVGFNRSLLGENSKHPRADGRQSMRIECWKVLEWLLLQSSTGRNESDAQTLFGDNEILLDQLLVTLVWYIRGNSQDSSENEKRHVRHLLRSLTVSSSWNASIVRRSSIAMAAVCNHQSPSLLIIRENKPSEPIAELLAFQHDRVFYWKCLSYCVDGVTTFLSLQKPNNAAVSELLDIIQMTENAAEEKVEATYRLAVDATECLCLFAQKIQSGEDGSQLMAALSNATLLGPTRGLNSGKPTKPSNFKSSICNAAIPGLWALIERQDGIRAFFQNPKYNDLLQSLCKVAVRNGEDNPNVAYYSAKIIRDGIIYMVKEYSTDQEVRQNQLQKHMISIIIALLTSKMEPITLLITDLICQLTETSISKARKEEPVNSIIGHQRRLIASSPQLVTSLAHVASDTVSSHQVRHRVIKAFHQMVNEDESAVAFLARQPKVLEAIVHAAACPYGASAGTIQIHAQTRKTALSVLLRLSTNACNRRLLAKQTGCLAVLIRYARSLPSDASADINGGGLDEVEKGNRLLRKENLKQQIFLLAKAL